MVQLKPNDEFFVFKKYICNRDVENKRIKK